MSFAASGVCLDVEIRLLVKWMTKGHLMLPSFVMMVNASLALCDASEKHFEVSVGQKKCSDLQRW